MKKDLFGMRKTYNKFELLEESISTNPFQEFQVWFDEALKSKILEANAMILSTSNKVGRVSSRVLLLKSFSELGFVFFTNYNSLKANQIKENQFASILFFWDILEKQIRIEGKIKKIPTIQSREYFDSRPIESKLGAIASNQSSILKNREELDLKYENLKNLYQNKKIEMPKNWGGYILIPDYFEFWQGRKSRLHDRICFKKERSLWKMNRLSP